MMDPSDTGVPEHMDSEALAPDYVDSGDEQLLDEEEEVEVMEIPAPSPHTKQIKSDASLQPQAAVEQVKPSLNVLAFYCTIVLLYNCYSTIRARQGTEPNTCVFYYGTMYNRNYVCPGKSST